MSEEKMTLRFYKIHYAALQLGTNDDYLVSRVFIDISPGETQSPSDFVNVKQTVGSSGHDTLLEVERPFHYKGPLDYAEFQKEVTAYYRWMIGPEGKAVKIDTSSRAAFRDCTISMERTVEIPLPSPSVGW